MAYYLIGTSGWYYDDWRRRFYPQEIKKSAWLEFYSRHFATVELNNTFYRLPSETAFINWYNATPDDFIFALKASRFITHIKKLKDTREAVNNFMSRAALLKEKLGPVLYQLPPARYRDDGLLEAFLTNLPPGYRHVLEFRHESWLADEVYDILRRYRAGICVFDMPDLTCPPLATADFAYIRFHGKDSLYASSYSDEELANWVTRIGELAQSLDTVYIYFNNDVQGFALKNAETIRNLIPPG